MEIYEGKRHHQESSKSSRSPSPQTSFHNGELRSSMQTPPPMPSRVGPPPSPPVPTHPIAPVPPDPVGPLPLSPCPVCSRTFVPQSLSKHIKICEKMTVKKRKTFDSSRQRREGTDLEQYLPKNFGLPENSPFCEKSPPQTAKPVVKPKPSVRTIIAKPSAELSRCPHCSRTFGMRAFERHVEWCADKAKILPAQPVQQPRVSDAKQRLDARTRYKAPPVRSRRTSSTRDKSSHSRSGSVESYRGVSPPREYGDHRNPRRASESVSSNDYLDDHSPHVPVIRNTRTSLNSSSGDANVRARQARLARDLSSTRYDDTYDPFASAARQMKELMSSETNIPKKIQNSSNSTRTLPILRPSREKSISSLRADNTKMMKDSLNKTYQYQKTPTLQRMKSFGSTTNDNSYTFGSRCNSFRNKNDKKSSQQKLNTTFTKSSKENISTIEKNYFNRSSNMNRSFSSYTTSSYSTPKPKEKTPKIASSMYHSFQKSTIKQPVKLDKIATPKKEDNKKTFVNLDSILGDDNSSTTDSNYIEPSLNNSSMTDSNYIDPRLINENDNLPINVNTILNNPDIISSMESLLTTENLPSKFDSFNMNNNVQNSNNKKETSKSVESVKSKTDRIETNNNINDNLTTPFIDNLSAQYDKLMTSLKQSINSKASIRDDESVCEDFDLEEFMISFDDEVHKQQLESKRTCSSTTRVVKQAELESNKTSELNSACSSPKILLDSNGILPLNKSTSFNFSANNVMGDSVFPSSVKRSTSLLESIQKKSTSKTESAKSRHRADILEQDIMQSLKEFDKFYESERVESQPVKETVVYNTSVHNGTAKRESSVKAEKKQRKPDNATNGNYTPSGKSNDSAYSSLNRISPSKLSVCNSKDSNSNGQSSLDRIPAGSDSSGCQKDEVRSLSSEEFLAMERSAELDAQLIQPKLMDNPVVNDKHSGSRASSRHSTNNQWPPPLSSSSSEISLHRGRRDSAPAPPPRLSRFCHECGSKFPMDTAKFCIECGVKRLTV